MSRPKKSFAELNKAELVAAAQRYGSLDEGTNEEIRTSLITDGVTWDQYAKDFGLVDENTANVVTSGDVTGNSEGPHVHAEVVNDTVTTGVTTVNNPVIPEGEKFLVKMVRENPSFEFGSYKFTQEKPFAIMPFADAQRILTEEEGFVQATPLEAQEYFR